MGNTTKQMNAYNIYDFNLGEQIVWPTTGEKDLFFETKQTPVWFDKTQKTNWKFIYRDVQLEEGVRPKLVSIMSNRYGLMPNQEINDEVIDYPEFNFKLDVNRSTNKGDKFFQMVYDIEGMQDLIIPTHVHDCKGDSMKPKLVIKSSYDGSKPLTAMFGFFRVICANLLVIPVSKETVFSFSAKHYKNFPFKEKIRKFIAATINEKVFEDSRAKVMLTKQSNVVDVDYSFFASLPTKELVLYVGMLQRYAKDVKVRILDHTGKLMYNVESEDSVKNMVGRIVKDNRGDEAFVTDGTFDRYLEQVSWLTYPETVLNQWEVYNLMIKLSQVYIAKERRLEKAQFIANHFLNQPALAS